MPDLTFVQGNAWQMAVATDIKNRRFSRGTRYSNVLSTPVSYALSQSPSLVPQRLQVVTGAGNYVEDIVQFGNKVKLNRPGEGTEELEAIAAYVNRAGAPASGYVYLRNQDNEINYLAGDDYTIWGDGRAGAWYLASSMSEPFVMTAGIRRGVSHIGNFGRTTATGSVSSYATGVAVCTVTMSPTTRYLLGLWNDGSYIARNTTRSSNAYSLLNLVDMNTSGVGTVRLSVPTSWQNGDTVSFNVITGLPHVGGRNKPFAQKLYIPATKAAWFYNILVSGGAEAIRQGLVTNPWKYSELVKNAYYRASLTYRVIMEEGNTTNMSIGVYITASSNLITLGTITPTAGVADTGWVHWISSPISFRVWESMTDSPTFLLIATNSNATYSASLYLDNVALGHSGNLNYPSDGCLDFARYSAWPAANSVGWDFIESKETTAENSDGSQSLIDLSGARGDVRYIVSANFENVTQEFWDDLIRLKFWQDQGHLLVLHPFLNDLPQTLVGTMKIGKVQKNFWDLRRRSFELVFTEIV